MWNSTEKRSRSRHDDDQMAPEAKARRFEALERLSGELVDRVATVNADVIGSLLAKWEHTAHEGLAARARATELESRVVKAKEEQARAEVTTAAVTQQLHRHAVLLDSMEAKLQQSASKAAETVVRQLDALMTPSLRRTAAQLEKERDINDALAERVQQFLAQCMRTLQVSSQRALEAELQTAESAVTIARLKASLTFEQTRSFRHTEEIETLLVILRARSPSAQEALNKLNRICSAAKNTSVGLSVT